MKFQATIAINGFPMVFPPVYNRHLLFFEGPTIDLNGFPMFFEILMSMVLRFTMVQKSAQNQFSVIPRRVEHRRQFIRHSFSHSLGTSQLSHLVG